MEDTFPRAVLLKPAETAEIMRRANVETDLPVPERFAGMTELQWKTVLLRSAQAATFVLWQAWYQTNPEVPLQDIIIARNALRTNYNPLPTYMKTVRSMVRRGHQDALQSLFDKRTHIVASSLRFVRHIQDITRGETRSSDENLCALFMIETLPMMKGGGNPHATLMLGAYEAADIFLDMMSRTMLAIEQKTGRKTLRGEFALAAHTAVRHIVKLGAGHRPETTHEIFYQEFADAPFTLKWDGDRMTNVTYHMRPDDAAADQPELAGFFESLVAPVHTGCPAHRGGVFGNIMNMYVQAMDRGLYGQLTA